MEKVKNFLKRKKMYINIIYKYFATRFIPTFWNLWIKLQDKVWILSVLYMKYN